MRQRKTYPSDLTDAPWVLWAPLLPPAQPTSRGGRPRTVTRREGRHTVGDLNRRGCPWERLPPDGLPQSTVSDSCAQWRDEGTWTTMVPALRAQTRVPAGREPTPSALCLASPSVQPTAMGGPERGDAGGQTSTGRTRPLWVATRGVWLAGLIPSARLEAGVAAPLLLGQVPPHALPRLVPLVAEQTYPHHALDAWRAEPRAGWHIVLTVRPEGTKGCTPLAQRWGMERTHAWPGRYRRHSKD